MRAFALCTFANSCQLTACLVDTQVVGNTFLHQHEQPDSKVALSSAALSLAACLPGQAIYQTVMLMNHGDTAVQFDVQGLLQSPGFSCKPERSAFVIWTVLCTMLC